MDRQQFGRVGVLLGALLTCLMAGPADAGLVMRYEGTLAGVMDMARPVRPSSVTVNPVSGEVCVTDEGGQALLVYNTRNINIFQTGNVADISNPRDGAIELWGGFVCLDTDEAGRRSLRRLNYLGEPLSFEVERPTESWSPSHLIVARDGGLITLDDFGGILAKHDGETGKLLWFRSIVDDPQADQLILGRPAEAPDGRIFVPGGEERRVLVLSESGEYLSSFGVAGTAKGGLAFPIGVAFGLRGTILVLDRMRHTILAYDQEFRFLGEYGTLGARPGNFYHPVAIAALPDGRLWVAQGFEGRVQSYRFFETDTDAFRDQNTAL